MRRRVQAGDGASLLFIDLDDMARVSNQASRSLCARACVRMGVRACVRAWECVRLCVRARAFACACIRCVCAVFVRNL